MSSYSNLGKSVRAAREKLGLTRSQAATKLKLSAGYLGLIERSNPTYVSEAVADKLIKTLGAPVSIKRSLASINKAASKESAKWRKVMAKSKKAA